MQDGPFSALHEKAGVLVALPILRAGWVKGGILLGVCHLQLNSGFGSRFERYRVHAHTGHVSKGRQHAGLGWAASYAPLPRQSH